MKDFSGSGNLEKYKEGEEEVAGELILLGDFTFQLRLFSVTGLSEVNSMFSQTVATSSSANTLCLVCTKDWGAERLLLIFAST